MKTQKAFVVNYSKDDKDDYYWFVRHPSIEDGKSIPIYGNSKLIEYLRTKVKELTLIFFISYLRYCQMLNCWS